MPGVSQTVIMTRDEGRTPVPEKESLVSLAAHGSTLCLFLSVSDMEKLCGKLLAAGRPPETAAAVVYRASWENEVIVRGTIGDIARKVAEAGIKRQAMIVIGDVLRKDGSDYRLPLYLRGMGVMEFFWGPLSLKAGVGLVMVASKEVTLPVYERVGAYYNFGRNYVGVALNATAGRIEFIEWTYGRRLF